MKIIIITQDEPFFIPKILESIVQEYPDIIGKIVLLKPDEYKNILESFIYYSKFWGILQLIKFGIKYTYKKANRNLTYGSVKVERTGDVNQPEFINEVHGVDYVLSIASNQIFKKDLLNAPSKMCLNIHAGLLPAYRGFNPSFWALYNEETVTGITLHRMTEKIDQGEIIKQIPIMINTDETWYTLQEKVCTEAINLLKSVIPQLKKDDFEFIKSTKKGFYCPKPTTNHGKEFRKKGKKFI